MTDHRHAPVARPPCPACGLPLGRRSRHRGFVEGALSAVDVYPFRCPACGNRFLAFRSGHRSPIRHGRRATFARVAVAIPCELGPRDGAAGVDEPVAVPLDRAAAFITDLTVNGAAVATDASLATDTKVSVTLRPSTQAEPIVIEEAVVRWTQPGRVGVGFVAMGANERARLTRLSARGYARAMTRVRRATRRPLSTSGETPWLLLAVFAMFVVMLAISLVPLLYG